MAMSKISSFIVSVLLVAMVVGVFAVWISELKEGYGINKEALDTLDYQISI